MSTKMWWSTMSKTFEKSKNIISVINPLSEYCYVIFQVHIYNCIGSIFVCSESIFVSTKNGNNLNIMFVIIFRKTTHRPNLGR